MLACMATWRTPPGTLQSDHSQVRNVDTVAVCSPPGRGLRRHPLHRAGAPQDCKGPCPLVQQPCRHSETKISALTLTRLQVLRQRQRLAWAQAHQPRAGRLSPAYQWLASDLIEAVGSWLPLPRPQLVERHEQQRLQDRRRLLTEQQQQQQQRRKQEKKASPRSGRLSRSSGAGGGSGGGIPASEWQGYPIELHLPGSSNECLGGGGGGGGSPKRSGWLGGNVVRRLRPGRHPESLFSPQSPPSPLRRRLFGRKGAAESAGDRDVGPLTESGSGESRLERLEKKLADDLAAGGAFTAAAAGPELCMAAGDVPPAGSSGGRVAVEEDEDVQQVLLATEQANRRLHADNDALRWRVAELVAAAQHAAAHRAMVTGAAAAAVAS